MCDVQVVKQCAPPGIIVEHAVSESDQAAAVLGDDRVAATTGLEQPLAPHSQTVGRDVAVEKGVGVSAPIVATPAVGVQRRDRRGVGMEGEPKLHRLTIGRDRPNRERLGSSRCEARYMCSIG
jgi:hypothetical protein